MLDDLARTVGWTVMIGLAIYVIGTIIIRKGEKQDQKRNEFWMEYEFTIRLAMRRVWGAYHDEAVRAQVKSLYGNWAMLFLDLDDTQYEQKMLSGGDCSVFRLAQERVKKDGYAYTVVDGKIVLASQARSAA